MRKRIKKVHELLVSPTKVPVPFEVWRFMSAGAHSVEAVADQAFLCASADGGTLPELRKAVEWYVDQLGGEVVWK